ncbi:nascent polypeptide-associated complex subunit alpha, muscle-specific form isoform X3 [Venturia canescens]|uniref:nascent polypeptide-associated complex subunit alpha, muscle-specific form isoform X3 n=1 Tax=Venturia canescens TaxID=32260 RepID=UPI001C9D3020|nr:nascent polypeptide-associated complex subunit alpha, muscle-specific form isoform X3 [Venturia canescens]
MESQQTPRAPGDSFAERAPPTVKQNPPSLPANFQARPQAHHPAQSPRFPANEAFGIPPSGRPGIQQPRAGLRPESRPPLGASSTVPVPGQFLQSRPPFGPPRPPNPHGNPIQGPPRSANPAQNPQIVQGSGPRFPGGPSGPPGVRPLGGARPPIFPAHQQARNGGGGEIRPQRTINVDSFGSSPTSASPFYPRSQPLPQNSSRAVPETVLTTASPPRDDSTLIRDETRSNLPKLRTSSQKYNQQRGTMQVADSRSPSLAPGSPSAENERTDNSEENEAIKRDGSSRGERDEDEDDDDDVVVDEDANSTLVSTPGAANGARTDQTIRTDSPGTRSLANSNKSATPTPENPDRSSPSPAKLPNDQERPGSRNSYKISATPSPTPPLEHPDRSATPGKTNANEEPSGHEIDDTGSGKTSATPRPTNPSPLQDPQASAAKERNNETGSESGLSSRSESRHGEPATSERAEAPSRSPASMSRTPENPTNLSVPLSPASRHSSASPSSPKSPKSPLGSVKGFDDGQPRSLSPKSPGRSITPASANSTPASPAISDKSATETDRKRATFANEPTDPNNEPAGKPPTPGSASERARTPSSAAGTPDGPKTSSVKRSSSGRSIKSDAGSESGAERTNHSSIPTTNGVALSPTKKLPGSKSRENNEKRTTAGSPIKSPSKSVKSLPRTPDAAVGPPSTAEKKIPMNKVQVGAAPSPNLKTVRSKIGSLDNASYKPGGGKVKIENRKLDFSKAQPKIAAKNDKYMPSGGDKKITQVKLQWNAKPKVGSLDNATYKPGGGDKKIETVKLDFKDKAKPKVGSKDNAKHVPGGGAVKSSSTPPKTPQDPAPNNDQMKELPKTPAERPNFIEIESSPRTEPNPPPSTPTRRRRSPAPVSPLTPRALRKSLQSKSPESPSVKRVTIFEESRDDANNEGAKTPSPRKSLSADSSTSSSSSPKGVSLPKLTRSPPSEITATDKRESGMKLPKLVETSSLSNRVRQMQ